MRLELMRPGCVWELVTHVADNTVRLMLYTLWQAAYGEQSLMPLYFVGAFFLLLAFFVGRCVTSTLLYPANCILNSPATSDALARLQQVCDC